MHTGHPLQVPAPLRRPRRRHLPIAGLGLLLSAGLGAYGYDALVAPSKPTTALLTASAGWQIYPGQAYRIGPSIIRGPGGSLDMWTCGPNPGASWDAIYHRHSGDGGRTWSADRIVFAPTPGTRDARSTCDPGVIKIGPYYYVGYTSTEDPTGHDNQLYLARGRSPDGPFAKWNGTGWGGDPEPIVSYQGPSESYGVGQPSFVLREERLFVYYTNTADGNHTDLATVNGPFGDRWPARLAPRGHAVTRRGGSLDVKYVDALDKFIAVGTSEPFTHDADIAVYQSREGTRFEPAPFRGERVQEGAHNAGISGNASGHIAPGDRTVIAYAYQPAGRSAWGRWPTFLSPARITEVEKGRTVFGWTSSSLDWRWSPPYLWDGDPGTVYSSGAPPTADSTETVSLDLGSVVRVEGVALTPRAKGYGFPVDFRLQTSDNGVDWSDVPGQRYHGFPRPVTTSEVRLEFDTPVAARFVRLVATKLGVDDYGNRYLQLGEIVPVVR